MAAPSRIAAALDYLERLKAQADQANAQTQLQTAKVTRDFAGGVGQNLANRARDLGQLGYEAFTSAPATPQTTAEFAELASQRQPTPMLDATVQGLGQVGKALVTDPIGTGKAVIGGEIDRARSAASSPAAAGEYAGGFIDPMRIAKALRRAAPVLELDVYHGTPHRFPATEANPLGEFDASKIGTGEGAQAYGHGVYLAESPDVAKPYKTANELTQTLIDNQMVDPSDPRFQAAVRISTHGYKNALDMALRDSQSQFLTPEGQKNQLRLAEQIKALKNNKVSTQTSGSIYKADLPDEMIDKMLDWDKPLSEQPKNVRETLQSHPVIQNEIAKRNANRIALNEQSPGRLTHPVIGKLASKSISVDDLKGSDIYQILSNYFRDEDKAWSELGLNPHQTKNIHDAASRYASQLGIPGIRYLDAGSRDGGSNTRNFVVFPGEEKKVKILERK